MEQILLNQRRHRPGVLSFSLLTQHGVGFFPIDEAVASGVVLANENELTKGLKKLEIYEYEFTSVLSSGTLINPAFVSSLFPNHRVTETSVFQVFLAARLEMDEKCRNSLVGYRMRQRSAISPACKRTQPNA